MIRIFLFIYFFVFCQLSYAISFNEYKTEQNTTLWHMYAADSPLISVDVAFPIGSIYDSKNKSGTASLMAATMDEGAGDYDSKQFRGQLKKNNIDLYYSASHQFFTLRLSFFKFDVDLVKKLVKLSLSKPRFDQKSVDLMKSQLIAALQNDQNDAGALGDILARSTYYQDHPFGRKSQGSLKQIKNITKKDLREFHKLLSQKGVFISVVGDMNKKESLSFAEDILSVLPSDNAQKLSPPSIYTPKISEQVFFMPLPVSQSHITLQTTGIRRNDKDFMAAYVGAHILGGGGFGSKLIEDLRERNGLTYSVSSYFAASPLSSRFMISYATQTKNVEKSLDVLNESIANFVQTDIAKKQFNSAIRYLEGSYYLQFNTNAQISHLASSLWKNNLSYDYPQKRSALLKSLTPQYVTKIMRDILKRKFQTFITGGGMPKKNQMNIIKKQDIDL